MDVFAHALWTTAAAKIARDKTGRQLHLGWAAFWGIFPDVFSFAVPAVVRVWWYVTGTTHSLMPDAHSGSHFQFVWQLYHCSHSLVVFGGVFALVWVVLRRPVWEMLGWGLHILMDILTHQGIFAVHFLWPFSSYAVSALRWEDRWFLAVSYAILMAVFAWMWVKNRKMGRHDSLSGASLPGGFAEKNTAGDRPLIRTERE